MGSGIAQVAAQGGYNVIIRLQMSLFDWGLTEYPTLWRIQFFAEMSAEERDRIFSRLRTTDLEKIHNADMVIEAIIENVSVKKQVFAE